MSGSSSSSSRNLIQEVSYLIRDGTNGLDPSCAMHSCHEVTPKHPGRAEGLAILLRSVH